MKITNDPFTDFYLMKTVFRTILESTFDELTVAPMANYMAQEVTGYGKGELNAGNL